jgi:hypothetical protein
MRSVITRWCSTMGGTTSTARGPPPMGPAVPEAALGMLPVGVFGPWSRYTFAE